MNNELLNIISNFRSFDWTRDLIDVVIIAIGFYVLIVFARKSRAGQLVKGLLLLLAFYAVAYYFRLRTVRWVLSNVMQIGFIAVVVLFQPEIRRFLEKLGTGSIFSRLLGAPHTLNADAAITQTVLACVDMSATRTGALIIFERDNRLDDQIRTGTILDAETTAELLKNIFYPKAPLHDGAAIIRSGRIQAAGCMLPLSNNPNLSKELGMRHRAGIGMSEASDAVVVIVSEETGAISVAVNGMLKRHLTKDTFEKILRNELIPEVKEEPTGAFRFLRRKEKDKADE